MPFSNAPNTTAPTPTPAPSAGRKRPLLYGMATAVLLIVIFYYGKPVLMPLALAGLFSFLLNPVVNLLHRCRLPRAVAVMLVTIFVFSALGVIGWVIGREFSSLAASLPGYKENIRERVKDYYEGSKGGVMDNIKEIKTTIEETAAEASEEAKPPAKLPPDGVAAAKELESPDPSQAQAQAHAPAVPNPTSAPTPAPEEEQDTGPDATEDPAAEAKSKPKPKPKPKAEPPPQPEEPDTMLPGMLGSAGEWLGSAATVIVFVIFMLLRQQELRNRLMRLAGFRHVTVVTRAMDETGDRVGRYLLMQALINSGYGVVLAVGLYFIGMPYVVLWGVLAALFRFIPYVGPVVVAVLPSALSLAVFNDWQHPLMVITLILGLELVTNMLVEPVLYGSSVGVSEFALLVSIVFWTWIWGSIGLIMATPLTVCLVVMAKHIPKLEWVDILMGDNPPVKSYMVLYQRLLAEDEAEAGDFINRQIKEKPVMEVMDETVLPAIALAKREVKNGRLTSSEEQQLHESVFRVMEGILPTAPEPESGAPLILGRPLDEGADEAGLHCFERMLAAGLNFDVVPAMRLSSEFHAEVEERKPAAVLLSATPPGSHSTARIQIRRLRQQFPKLKIYIGRWGVPDDVANAPPLLEAGANAVFTRLTDAESALTLLIREAAAVGENPAASRNGEE